MRIFDKVKLKILIKLHNNLYKRINFLSRKLNNDIHPKHRIMGYHQFFLDNIDENSRILDIGCSIGNVTYHIAEKAQLVVGIDRDEQAIHRANKIYKRDNIRYIIGDATKFEFNESFDYIILSNVLEHIKDRINFLNKIKKLAKHFLIRVPMIDRSWLVLYKKELGYEYRLDPTHYIEYTLESFQEELESAGFKIGSYSIQFGEIWAKLDLN